ncbi:MATE family efflux transporter [Enterobacter hormaechei]
MGYNLGQRSTEQARTSAITALAVGLMLASCTAILSIIFREKIALMYNDNIEVVTLASHLMLFAALYQLSDSYRLLVQGYYGVIKISLYLFYYLYRLLGNWFAFRISLGTNGLYC